MAIEHQEPERESKAGCLVGALLFLLLLSIPFWDFIGFLFGYFFGEKSFG